MLPRRSLSNATRSSLLDQVRRRSWVSVDKMLEILNHWIFFGQIQHQLDSIVAIYIGKIMVIHWNWEYQANSWGPNFWGNTEVFRCGIMALWSLMSLIGEPAQPFDFRTYACWATCFLWLRPGVEPAKDSQRMLKHVFAGVLWNLYKWNKIDQHVSRVAPFSKLLTYVLCSPLQLVPSRPGAKELGSGSLVDPSALAKLSIPTIVLLLLSREWEWGNGMIITSDYGSFPKIPY